MKQPKFGPIILAGVLFIALITSFMIYVNYFMGRVTNVDNLASVFDQRKFDGLFIDKKALSGNGFLYIFDSSNLSNTDCRYHPSNIFKGKVTGFIPYLCGREAITSIYHVLKIAALDNSFRNRKLVYLVEPSNFLNQSNSPRSGAGSFSSLQAYQFVLNSHISKNLKAAIARSLLKSYEVYRDPVLTILLKELTYHRPNKVLELLTKPIGHVMLKCLKQIDYFNAYQLVVANNRNPYHLTRRTAPNWPDLLINAQKDGASACRTNNFGIEDTQYNEDIRPNLNNFRDRAKRTKLNYMENDDFYLLLCLFKELKIKPLIIIQPVKGLWSDSIGLSKETRYQFYRNVKLMTQKAGYDYVDLSKYEYEKYFLHDTKHLGWKGWVYIDQKMDRYYHQ